MKGDPTHARCPGCGSFLTQSPVSHGVLAGCETCGGLWLDNPQAHAILSGRAATEERRFIRSISEEALGGAERKRPGYREPAAHGERACPVCRGGLKVQDVDDPVIKVDVCEQHGTFFDRHELALVLSRADARTVEHFVEVDRQRAIDKWNESHRNLVHWDVDIGLFEILLRR